MCNKKCIKYKTNKYNGLVNVIKNGLFDLKNEIKKMSGDEKENEELNKRVDIVEKIFEFNKQNQELQELKILAPNQMLY